MRNRSLRTTLPIIFALLVGSCDSFGPGSVASTPAVHGYAGTKWIEYAGHQFRVSNVLDAELGKYGYKVKARPSAFHAEGDLPIGINFKTVYPLDVTYDSARTLNKLGINLPVVAGAGISGGTSSTGNYKIYVLKAANEQDWKRLIRNGVMLADQDLIAQLMRSDGYFRFVDAVLLVSDVVAKQRLDAKLSANATYQSIRAELDATGHSGGEIIGREPRVIGYSMRGACWGPPNYSQLLATPDDRPAAGDSGACQRELDNSPVYQRAPQSEGR